MKIKFNKKRHIHQKTSADCALASMAMLYNMPWESIKDLFTSEILHYKLRLNMDENDPAYYDILFNEVFSSGGSEEESDEDSGLVDSDKYYLNKIIGAYENSIEVPYLLIGVPCLVSTMVWNEGDYEGHSMFFDGVFVHDPALSLNDYDKMGAELITDLAISHIPPFGSCEYFFNDSSVIPKHIAEINKIIGHSSPSQKMPFRVVYIKDFNSFTSDNYDILYVSSIENANKTLSANNKMPDLSFEQYLESYPEFASPYFSSSMGDKKYPTHEEFKEKADEYFDKIKKEIEKEKIKNNPQEIEVTFLPKKIYQQK